MAELLTVMRSAHHHCAMSIDVQSRTLSDQVAEEIRVLLTRRRMSQAELARRLNVTGTWLNYRLTGRQEIGLNDLALIAGALEVDPAELVTGVSGTVKLRNPAPAQKPRSDRPRDNRPRTQNRGARRTQLTRDYHAA